MARGAADDSNVRIEHDIYRLDDFAELAVRLGSIVTYNRYGSVLMLDGFEEGVSGWETLLLGAGASVKVSNDRAYNGRVSCEVLSGTGAIPWGAFYKYLPPVNSQLIGLQTCFSIHPDVESLVFRLSCGKAPRMWHFGVLYDHVGGTLQYQWAHENYTPFATPGKLYDGSANWHNFKMVIDVNNDQYVRCYLDNEGLDMKGIDPDWEAWGFGRCIHPFLLVIGDGATTAPTYFDNVIVTYNEF